MKEPSEQTLKNKHIKQMNKLTKIIRNSTIDELWRYYNHKLLSSEYNEYKKYGLFGWEDSLYSLDNNL